MCVLVLCLCAVSLNWSAVQSAGFQLIGAQAWSCFADSTSTFLREELRERDADEVDVTAAWVDDFGDGVDVDFADDTDDNDDADDDDDDAVGSSQRYSFECRL